MPKEHRPIVAAASDPIRIVALHGPQELFQAAPGVAAGPPPQLTYRGGPLLTAVEVFTVFWGEAWNAQPLAGIAQSLNQFFQFILTSPLLDQMSEYSVPQY